MCTHSTHTLEYELDTLSRMRMFSMDYVSDIVYILPKQDKFSQCCFNVSLVRTGSCSTIEEPLQRNNTDSF